MVSRVKALWLNVVAFQEGEHRVSKVTQQEMVAAIKPKNPISIP